MNKSSLIINTNMKENMFQKIKRIDDSGSEYWSSRELSEVLEYSDYRKFLNVIEKAQY